MAASGCSGKILVVGISQWRLEEAFASSSLYMATPVLQFCSVCFQTLVYPFIAIEISIYGTQYALGIVSIS